MKIVFVGDTHGTSQGFELLAHLAREYPEDVPIIQVGDFGFWPQLRNRWVVPERPIYFIDGNHDHIPAIRTMLTTEKWPNARFIDRGDIIVCKDGTSILFCGGATSVDRHYRHCGNIEPVPVNAWFHEEDVTQEEIERALRNSESQERIDLLVTHCPPRYIVDEHFGPLPRNSGWRFPTAEGDISARRIQDLWAQLRFPTLICGHMHRSMVADNCRILGINEVYEYEHVDTSK